ncbi:hypothetical protein TNCV_2859231 [Trichonephila clavipes]|nr:hypothetical protein TNCV_2859231 [Trichonephila clavipes]
MTGKFNDKMDNKSCCYVSMSGALHTGQAGESAKPNLYVMELLRSSDFFRSQNLPSKMSYKYITDDSFNAVITNQRIRLE